MMTTESLRTENTRLKKENDKLKLLRENRWLRINNQLLKHGGPRVYKDAAKNIGFALVTVAAIVFGILISIFLVA